MTDFRYHPEIAKLGAAHLFTPDLEKSVWFFHDILGMHITARTDTKVYLRAAMEREHHSLVLEAGDRARLDHVSWRVRRPEDIEGGGYTGRSWHQAGSGTRETWREPSDVPLCPRSGLWSSRGNL